MRVLAVGDIHGCYRSLLNLSEFVPFRDDDIIITLGDYVDRGPDSKSVVNWVMNRTLDGKCIPLRGNHEIMMLAAMRGDMPMQQWLQYGGDACLKSYSHDGYAGSAGDVDDLHKQFLEQELFDFHETESHIFVHAGMLANIPTTEQAEFDLFWERFDSLGPHMSGKTIICGHTAQITGVPANRAHAVCIDTWVYGRGWLTCLDVETGEYWQADEHGHTRKDLLRVPQE